MGTKDQDWSIPPSPNAVQRPLVIDGCNIGRSASGFARTYVDCIGLVAVSRWLLMKNFDVTVFLPVVYNNINNYNARNTELLHKLELLGIVTFTPARSGRGMRRAFINYDDLYVVSYAARHGGCILSGDKFKDILNQKCYSDFHSVIRNRTVEVRFRPLSLDFVRHQSDLFYKHTPELFIFDTVYQRADVIRQKLFVTPEEDGYQLAAAHRRRLSPERRRMICAELDQILYSMSVMEGKEFQTVENLPFIETTSNVQLLRIEDVFSSQFCEEFYQCYPPMEGDVDALSPYVMEPIYEINDAYDLEYPQEDYVAGNYEEGEEEGFEFPDRIVEGELIDLTANDEEKEASTDDVNIHPDLADIEFRPSFPKDLSSSALLEWFSNAEKLDSKNGN